MSEHNPLLEMEGLPPFSKIEPKHILPAMEDLLLENREAVAWLMDQESSFGWDTLVQPLEEMEDRLGRVSGEPPQLGQKQSRAAGCL